MAAASNPWDFFGVGSKIRNLQSPYNLFYAPDTPDTPVAKPTSTPNINIRWRGDDPAEPSAAEKARSAAIAGNGGVVPTHLQTGADDEIVGSFTGRNGTRTLTRAQAGPASDQGVARRQYAPDTAGNASFAGGRVSTPDARDVQKQIGTIDDALWRLQHTGGGLNMRSKREMFQGLLGQRGQLTGQVFDANNQTAQTNARLDSDAGQGNAQLAEQGARRRGDSRQAYDAFGENIRQFDVGQDNENRRSLLAYEGQQAGAQADLIKAAAEWQRNNDNDATARVEARAQANIKDGMKADEAYRQARYDEAALQAQSGRGAKSNFQSAAGQADALSTAEQASANTGIWQYLQNVGTGRDWYLPGSQEAIAPNSLTSADQVQTTEGNWTDYLRPGTGEGIEYTDSKGRKRTAELSEYPGLTDTLRTLQTRGAPRR